MAGSKQYGALTKAVNKLRRGLLPRKFDPTGTYARAYSIHLRSLSFRILVHAEIESYLEDRANELVGVAWKEWKAGRLTTDVTVALLAYAGIESVKPPGKLGGDPENQKSYEDFGVILERANSAWRYVHKNNHGIKEPNVLALFLPLGLNPSDLDSTLLADLTSYGSKRGEVAHKSSAFVSIYADPLDEFNKARQLVADLMKFDSLVNLAISRIERVARALAA